MEDRLSDCDSVPVASQDKYRGQEPLAIIDDLERSDLRLNLSSLMYSLMLIHI